MWALSLSLFGRRGGVLTLKRSEKNRMRSVAGWTVLAYTPLVNDTYEDGQRSQTVSLPYAIVS